MSEEIAISLRNVSKSFKRYHRPVDRLKEILLPGENRSDEFWALRDINLEIPKGQTFGIIGRNGSGKSTMLQIIAGTLTPTTGEVRVKGRVSALLELGSGFNPEFTGRQNVFFNGRLLGLSQTEIESKFDEIAAFADIGDFIEQPVKTYSSGMFVRLAFAVAVNVDPEVLIVDEALAVGDIAFQHRCMRRMRSLMDSGVTTLFVSHDSGAIKTLCNYAVMIHDGQIYTSGFPSAVIIEYMKLMTNIEIGLEQNEQTAESNTNNQTNDGFKQLVVNNQIEQLDRLFNGISRRGNGNALIERIELIGSHHEFNPEQIVFGFNEEVTLVAEIKAVKPLKGCVLGFFICDKNGNEILGTNTFEERVDIKALQPEQRVEIRFKFKLPLRTGSYSLTVAGAENPHAIPFDWIDNAIVFQVLPPESGKQIHSLVDIPIDVTVDQIEQSVIKEHVS
ncbi:ABC transporter ATP-binding protein [Calothrix sp. NIES-3974]|uniref:ABC transporter ATP-binding protein n=1 Tax=Calothrix sp. NIES-3974 TaxID=2005462 RepID=UPI000B5E7346|nr:ABC transporter ATP-binding protein [Calothrix sp. NIES-3974]BAZ07213.1 ABC transporter-related protein [Calothrix sp. NIES-3974]